jgi:hypothetical protein
LRHRHPRGQYVNHKEHQPLCAALFSVRERLEVRGQRSRKQDFLLFSLLRNTKAASECEKGKSPQFAANIVVFCKTLRKRSIATCAKRLAKKRDRRPNSGDLLNQLCLRCHSGDRATACRF